MIPKVRENYDWYVVVCEHHTCEHHEPGNR